VAAVPADTDALALFPVGNPGTEFIDDARDFVAWNTGIFNAWPRAVFRERVAVADATGLHFDEHVSWTRLRNLALDDLKISARLGDLYCLHWC
jgi:hypothetical protein